LEYEEWYDYGMSAAKVTISLSPELLDRVDRLVQSRKFRSRSQAIQTAIQEKVDRIQRSRLAHECAKLDPVEEQALAEIGIGSETDLWPPY
jgi:Arc/MetJ-type ribon-helix-helix transcriptional regulator